MIKRLALFGSLLLAVAGSAAQDWPAFRGPRSDGAVVGSRVFSDRDGIGLSIRWSAPIGSGYSGPVIADGRVFTLARDGAHDVMWAFDAATGKTLWRFEIEPTYAGHDGSHDGPIATPVVAGEVVLGLSARGRLFALKAASGELIWSTSLPEDHGAPTPHYGFCTSPILVSGVLAVMLGGDEAAVAGFDPATGEKLWATGNLQVAYETPSVVADGDRELVLAAGMDKILAVDANSGELVWEHEHGGDGGRGAASLTAVPTEARRLFLAHKDDASAVVRWSPVENGATFETSWENRAIRNSYNVAVYHDGHLYAFSSRFLTCVNEKTGEVRWRSREPGDGFLALVDGNLVVVTKNGSLHIVEAQPDGYREVAAVNVSDDLVWSPPAFAEGSIWIRAMDGLARVDVGDAASRVAISDGEPTLPEDSEFGSFLAELETAEDRQALVEGFLAKQQSFPIIEPGWVHFVYRTDARDVAIGGDLIGSRQDRPMIHPDGTDLFWFSARLAPDGRVDYVFIEDYGEAVPDPRNPRQSVSSTFGVDMERPRGGPGLMMSWVAGPEWKTPEHLGETDPGRRGLVEHHELEIEGLEQPMVLDVWLPPGYGTDTARRYPVLFVRGAEPLEISGYDRVLDNLVGRGVAPLIAVFVGIPARELSAQADEFADRAVPFIDRSYRTIGERESRALLGFGFPGFSALYVAVKRPDTVGTVATQSMHLMDFMLAQLEPLIPGEKGSPEIRVVLEWSLYDLRNPHEAWDMREFNRRVAELLKSGGFRVEHSVTSEGPGWSGWRNRADDMLMRLFPASGAGLED